MRLAVVHNQPTGGARRALHGFCAQWRGRHSIDVFTLSTADDLWLHDADIADSVTRVPLRRRRPVRFGLYFNDFLHARDRGDLDAAYASIARRVDMGGYDAVLVDACQYSLVPSVLLHLRTPSVYYAHNGPAALEGGSWDSARTTWARLRSVWHAPFERRAVEARAGSQRRAIQAASVVATNSAHTRARLRAGLGVDAVVCPPGVDVPDVVVPTHSRTFVFSVGEIEPRKAFPFLVDAVGRIPEERRPVLRLAANRANPVERDALEARARAAGVSLEILIDPPPPILDRCYGEASAFVFAAHNEALGLAPLEAMAHGTAVVAVAEGGVTETVVDGATGLLVPREIDLFAAGLDALLRNTDVRERLGAAARVHVSVHWSTGVRANALETLLAETTAVERGAIR
jgi:glycosyltransferase involved in cell wall biosynthesis